MRNSPALGLVWQLAILEAVSSRYECVEPEHFLEALSKGRSLCAPGMTGDLAARGVDVKELRAELDVVPDALRSEGVDPTTFRRDVRRRFGRGGYMHRAGSQVHRSPRSREAFARAEALARVCGERIMLTGHLFAAVLDEKGWPGRVFLEEQGGDLDALTDVVLGRASGADLDPGREREAAASGVLRAERLEAKAGRRMGAPALALYGRDLTAEARAGKLGPFVGRRKELLAVIQTLIRRVKNNPVLVGDPGVGKTAIVEALAVRAVQGKDPEALSGRRIVEIDIGSLIAGTKFRGEFEERVKAVIEEARADPDVILFIDEIHTVVGAGKGEGGVDAANLMKPALARGDFRCMGATTLAEYGRYVESDPALERRFEKVMVPEPGREETLSILRALKPGLERHHGVGITERALESAVDLSVRFDGSHQLPDKAIDLVDKAGASARLPELSALLPARRVELPGGDAAGPADGEHAGPVPSWPGGPEVTEDTVAQVLAEKVGVPLEVVTRHLEGANRSRLLEMEAALKKRVIGQDAAIARVCERIVTAFAALSERRGPLAVFLFLGPTGVGKTELARSIAEYVFGSESDVIRLDMSEYSEEHSVAKLIGSPPGYVGHEEEGQLTMRLRTRPYSAVVLDEIEKAHPTVFDLFLQVFDEGRLTDSHGRTADARNAIFIMTSNIAGARGEHMGFRPGDESDPTRPGEGAPARPRRVRFGRGPDATRPDGSTESALREVARHFRPEFVNRIDEQIVFRPLDRPAVKAILGRMLEELRRSMLERYGKRLVVEDDALEFVASEGVSPDYGARHLRRTTRSLVEVPLSRALLDGSIDDWPAVTVALGDAGIELRRADAPEG